MAKNRGKHEILHRNLETSPPPWPEEEADLAPEVADVDLVIEPEGEGPEQGERVTEPVGEHREQPTAARGGGGTTLHAHAESKPSK